MPVGSLNAYRTNVGPLQRMVTATRPDGVGLVEEPDFVTIYGVGEPAALRRLVLATMRHLEATAAFMWTSKRR
jgi:hypothetical protein